MSNHLVSNLSMLLWCGKIDRAQDLCKKFARSKTNYLRPFDRELISYFCDTHSPNQLIDAVKASGSRNRWRMDMTTTYWLLGLEQLALGNSTEAKEYFDICAKEGLKYYTKTHWARAFSARLARDEAWTTAPMEMEKRQEN